MRELELDDITAVSGAGIIKNISASVGGLVGNGIYQLAGSVTVSVPLLGEMSIKKIFPELGTSIGASIGGNIGGTVESILGGIPFVGGIFNAILGN
ncbi:hypothetical protein AAGR22_18920 [Erwinia sp. HDF1-3R]|uniref:hypothetical protein n=1 Tax=Erwinia sp. HDF1-3R TaxID=3141543 RepID=UPI0031F5639F